ncbi:MAG: matrixin family metalloprotease [Rubrobacteraceae bacterium]
MAQAENSKVLEACKNGKDQVSAENLPPEVSLEECPVEDRAIVDNGVEAVLPDAGEGVYAEVLTAKGSQELVVARRDDGTVELNKVGDDVEESSSDDAESTFYGAESGPNPCRDRAYTLSRWKVYDRIAYRYNYRTTPRNLNRRAAGRAVRGAGANIVNNRNSCRIGDRVESGLAFQGGTRRTADVGSTGRCTRSDGRSVVSFGRLGDYLAVTCTFFTLRNGYDEVTSSDVRIDRSNVRWTTRPRARSCRRAYDVESVITHEFGHTFGLDHVSETRHPNQTMSPLINGPCQLSERTLGRGDVLGLTRKYR